MGEGDLLLVETFLLQDQAPARAAKGAEGLLAGKHPAQGKGGAAVLARW